MIPLKDVSIFDIKYQDLVFNAETGLNGLAQVMETQPECLEIFVQWAGTKELQIVNQYDKNIYLIKGNL